MSRARLVVTAAVAAAAVGAQLPAPAAADARARCTGGRTVAATKQVRVMRRGLEVTACHRRSGRKELLGTDGTQSTVDGVRISGTHVRWVTHTIQQDAQYDMEQVVDVRTGELLSAGYLPYGTAG